MLVLLLDENHVQPVESVHELDRVLRRSTRVAEDIGIVFDLFHDLLFHLFDFDFVNFDFLFAEFDFYLSLLSFRHDDVMETYGKSANPEQKSNSAKWKSKSVNLNSKSK